MDMLNYEPIIIIGCGFFGGLLNCVLFDGGLRPPYPEMLADGKKIYRPGSLGPLFLGIGASFLTWGFGIGGMIDLGNKMALLVLSGVGGGSVIINLTQKYDMGLERKKVEVYSEATREIAKNYITARNALISSIPKSQKINHLNIISDKEKPNE